MCRDAAFTLHEKKKSKVNTRQSRCKIDFIPANFTQILCWRLFFSLAELWKNEDDILTNDRR